MILTELRHAKAKWPMWVSDPVHAASILGEEAGETVKAANDFTYSGGELQDMADEAAQTFAMAIRLLAGLDHYTPRRCYLEQPK